MSIPLREGFVDETLERCLEDLLVRFVVNCPEEDLSSIERVLFQIEEAHWFYQDFLRTLNPLLPSMKMKQFTNKLIEQCPLIWKWGDPSEALSQFGKYKSTIPVRGCALLNSSMDKMLLVKGIESSSWGFPRGKISKGEKDLDCALRELEEETGFDASDLINEDEFVERTIKGKNYKIYIVSGVPDDTVFIPKVRYEIVDVKWMDIKYLTKAVKNTSNFYLVGSMLKSILSYIRRMKSDESDEELKRLATIQLKKILGIDENLVKNEETEVVDPGRALLSMLQSVAKNNQSANENVEQSNQNIQLEQQLKQSSVPIQQFPLQSQQQPFGSFPPNLLPYLQNKMIPLHAHNPFPLQMFNPYIPMALPNASFGMQPPLPFVNPTLPQPLMNHLAPQGMALAPSASSFSKPQFALSNKKPEQHANSKELLSILKSKPQPKESKKSNSSQLLNLLKKDAPSVSTATDGSKSVSPTGTIKILKREKTDSPIFETKNQFAKQHTEKITEIKEQFDITKPANDSTNRDISNSKPSKSGKPVVLLKKSTVDKFTPNTGFDTNTDKFTSEDTTASIISPRPNIDERRQTSSSGSRTPVPIDSLNLLTSPNESKNKDPSSQLLNILQRKSELNNGNASQGNIGIYSRPETPSLSEKSINSSNSHSNDLLNILKKRSSTPVKTDVSITNETKSNELLSLLHSVKPSTPQMEQIQKPSSQLHMSSSQSSSACLLDILKNPSQMKETDSTPLMANINNSQQTNSLSPNVFSGNIFQQNQQSLPPMQQQFQTGPMQNSIPLHPMEQLNPSSAILQLLKGGTKKQNLNFSNQNVNNNVNIQSPSHMNGFNNAYYQSQQEPVQHQNFEQFQQFNQIPPTAQAQMTSSNDLKISNNQPTFEDFEDFEDFDEGEIEGEYKMNGGLYDDDDDVN